MLAGLLYLSHTARSVSHAGRFSVGECRERRRQALRKIYSHLREEHERMRALMNESHPLEFDAATVFKTSGDIMYSQKFASAADNGDIKTNCFAIPVH